MNVVEQLLVDHLDELGLRSVGLDHRLTTVLLTPRFVTSRHVVALVLAHGDHRPRAVAKVPRRPGDDAGVRTEARALRQLAELAETGVAGAPALLGTIELDGRTVLVQSAVIGAPLDQTRVVQDIGRAVASGEGFLSGLPVVRRAEDNPAWYDPAVRTPLAGLMGMMGSAGDIAELCERTHAVLAPLRDLPLPAVFEHGDLSHPNLFVGDDETLLVIDWERATDAGVPGHDLVFFLQFVSQCRHGFATPAEQLRAFDRAFTGAGAWARPTLERHLRARGVDPRLAGLLVVTCWARAAATLASRLDLDARAAGGARDAVAAAVLAERDVTLWRHSLRRAEAGELLAGGR